MALAPFWAVRNPMSRLPTLLAIVTAPTLPACSCSSDCSGSLFDLITSNGAWCDPAASAAWCQAGASCDAATCRCEPDDGGGPPGPGPGPGPGPADGEGEGELMDTECGLGCEICWDGDTPGERICGTVTNDNKLREPFACYPAGEYSCCGVNPCPNNWFCNCCQDAEGKQRFDCSSSRDRTCGSFRTPC